MPPRKRRELLMTVLGMMLCLALTAGLLFLYMWTGRRNSLVLLFALLVPVLWAAPFYIRIRRLVATRHFTRGELMLGTSRPGLGQPLQVRLTLSARKAVQLEGCKLVLRAVETVLLKRHRTRTAEITRVETVLPTPDRLEKDREYSFEGALTVPVDGMESFEGRRAALRWEIEAFAMLGKVAVPLDRQELIVQPLQTGKTSSARTEASVGDKLRLKLKPGNLPVGSRAYFEVTIDDALAASAASVELAVSWRTRIAGVADVEEHSVLASKAEVTPGRSLWFDFLVPPAGPLSYTGKLFNVAWTARATLKSPDGKPIETTELPLTIEPRPA